MLCRNLTLTQGTESTIKAVPLICKCWHCDHCADILRRKVIKRAIIGRPTALLTLTTNPKAELSPDTAAPRLKSALATLIRRIRRRYPNHNVQYMAVFERTEAGWPHLHVLLRAPFIPQKYISQFMEQRTGAPIVDIRAVTSSTAVARYVGKYLSKDPTKFPGCQRYWNSREWKQADDDEQEPDQSQPPWQLWRATIGYVARYLGTHGFQIEWDDDPRGTDSFTAWRDPPPTRERVQ